MPERTRRLFVGSGALLLLAAATAFAWAPLLQSGLPRGHDTLDQTFRAVQRFEALRNGDLAARWVADMPAGLGYPVFHYYPPAASILTALGMLGGLDAVEAVRAVYLVSLTVSAAGAFFLIRRTYGALAGWCGALFYGTGPYILADIYARGAIAESLSLALLPWIFLAGEAALARDTPVRRASLIIGIAALTLTHLVILLLAAPVLGARLLLDGAARDRAVLLRLAACGLIGLGLGAFSWLPAILDLGLVRAGELTGQGYDLTANLLPLSDAVEWRATHPLSPDRPGFQAALIPICLAAAGALLLLTRGTGGRITSGFWAGALLISLLLQTTLVAPLTAMVPGLAFVQFPFRYLALTSLAQAILAAGAVTALGRSTLRVVVCAIAVVLWVGAVSWELRPEVADVTGENFGPYAAARYAMNREFFPRTSPVNPFDLLHLPPDEGEIPAARPIAARTSTEDDLVVEVEPSPEPTRLLLDTHAFPFWVARAGSRVLPTRAEAARGLLAVEVPADAERVTIARESTAAVRLGLLISLLAGAGGAFVLVASRWTRLGASVAVVFVGLGLALVRPQTDGTDLPGARGAFDIGAALLGGSVERGAVTLRWTTRRPIRDELRIAVRAIDSSGAVVARSDGVPSLGMKPVVAWAPGLVVRDRHDLIPAPGAAPGRYNLVVGVFGRTGYATPTGANLVQWQDDCACGTPGPNGRGILIGQVDVTETDAHPRLGGELRLSRALLRVEGAPGPLYGSASAWERTGHLVWGWLDRLMAGRTAEAAPLVVDRGATIALTQRWVALTEVREDHTFSAQILDARSRAIAQADARPAEPSERWRRGDAVAFRLTLTIPQDAGPGIYPLMLGAYRSHDRQRVHWTAPERGAEWWAVGRVKIRPPSSPSIGAPASGDLGQIRVIGLTEALPERVRPGAVVFVQPVWQVVARVPYEYRAFVHLADSDGRPVAQGDALPMRGDYPTSLWEPGERLADTFPVTVPTGDAGVRRVLVGLYRPETGERMRGPSGDTVDLGTIIVGL